MLSLTRCSVFGRPSVGQIVQQALAFPESPPSDEPTGRIETSRGFKIPPAAGRGQVVGRTGADSYRDEGQ